MYLWSLPRTVVLEDDGLFILTSYFNGIAHPPGYPLFTILGHLSTYIPVGSIAFRVHMLNAVIGALACVCLWHISWYLLKDRLYAMVTALAFGFSRAFWSQSIIAEVYSLNVLLLLLLCLLSLHYVATSQTVWGRRIPYALGFIYGLGLSNHWPLLVLSTPLLLAILWPCRRSLLKTLPASLLCLLPGLLPYAWLVWRSQMHPEFSFYGPINSLSELWFYVSREGYAEIDSSPSAGWWDKVQFGIYVLKETVGQYGPFGFFFIMLGFIRQWRVWPRTVSVGLLLGYLGNTVVLIGLLGFDYDVLHQAIFRVYPLIAYAICGLWLGLGLSVVVTWLTRRGVIGKQKPLLPYALSLLLVATTLMSNVGDNYRAKDTWAEDYARAILDSLEKDAILFTYSDMSAGPLFYLSKINEIRTDIDIYSGLSIRTDQLHRINKFKKSDRDALLDDFLRKTVRPTYFIEETPENFGVEHHGLYLRVSDALPKDKVTYINNSKIVNYLETILHSEKPVDVWEKIQYWQRVTNYCILATGLSIYNPHATHTGTPADFILNNCRSYYGLINIVPVLIQHHLPNWENIIGLLENAKQFKHQAMTKEDHAQFFNIYGVVMIRTGKLDKAIDYFENSMSIWPSNKNMAIKQLVKLDDLREK